MLDRNIRFIPFPKEELMALKYSNYTDEELGKIMRDVIGMVVEETEMESDIAKSQISKIVSRTRHQISNLYVTNGIKAIY